MNIREEEMKETKRLMLMCFATYVSMYGIAPSLRELKEMTGVHSTAEAAACMRELKAEGMIRASYRPHLFAV